MTAQEEFRDRMADKWQIKQATYDGDGNLTSQVEIPEREPYVPMDGATIKRRSTLVDTEGNVIQTWNVEAPEEKARQVAFQSALEAMRDALPRAPIIPAPTATLDDFLNVIPIGDHHAGMLAWKHEVGASYDLDIAEQLLGAATDHLLSRLQPAGRCLIAALGDFEHYDSMAALTPEHGNLLDADGRAAKMVRAAVRMLRYTIESAAAIHQMVHVIIEAGNHDPFSTLWMQELLRAKYEDNPRITIDGSPSRFHYYRFGDNFIGTHHGDKAKMEDLPIIMATDCPRDWGETTHRYIYTGHIHRRTALDVHGVSVESMRILPPPDAWAHQQGYRPIRDMKAIEIHRRFGEVGRYTFNPNMLEVKV